MVQIRARRLARHPHSVEIPNIQSASNAPLAPSPDDFVLPPEPRLIIDFALTAQARQFTNRRQQFAALTMRHGLPATAPTRDFADAGVLMSYGASNVDGDRQGGIYVGRVLKGDKPADLPVQQLVKVDLVINLIAAKALGLTVPLTLLGRADEVIE